MPHKDLTSKFFLFLSSTIPADFARSSLLTGKRAFSQHCIQSKTTTDQLFKRLKIKLVVAAEPEGALRVRRVEDDGHGIQ